MAQTLGIDAVLGYKRMSYGFQSLQDIMVLRRKMQLIYTIICSPSSAISESSLVTLNQSHPLSLPTLSLAFAYPDPQKFPTYYQSTLAT